MIVGLVNDVATQANILPAAMARALAALKRVDLLALEPGRYDLEGDDLYYVVQNPALRGADEIRPEAHTVYADIQMPLDARERYGFSLPEADLAPIEPPEAGKDVAFYPTPSNETFIDLNPGEFIVFLPGELHRSCMAVTERSTFKKVVVKVHSRVLGG